jgi:hypothetical protein
MVRRKSFRCPHCGATVPARAASCPDCGSDETNGWSEDAEAWAGDLPAGWGGDDEEHSSEDVLRDAGLSEVGRPSRAEQRRRRTAAVCLLLVACLLAWLVLR